MSKKNPVGTTSYLRFLDMRPYWNEKAKIDYPYREILKMKESVSLTADKLDTLFDLIPNVPISKIDVYDNPSSTKEDNSLQAKFERAVGIVDHRSVLLYTPVGVFAMDRYKKTIDISVYELDQLKAFLTKTQSERHILNEQLKIHYGIDEQTYYPYLQYLVKTAQSCKTMYDMIDLLKLNNGAIVSKQYNYLFNNCIANSNS